MSGFSVPDAFVSALRDLILNDLLFVVFNCIEKKSVTISNTLGLIWYYICLGVCIMWYIKELNIRNVLQSCGCYIDWLFTIICCVLF